MSCDVQTPAGDHQKTRWKYLDQIRNNAGPYTDPDAIAPESLDRFETMKLLVMSVMFLPRYLERSTNFHDTVVQVV
ncbi:NEDD8 activating enzyme [Fusarium poae]